MDSMSSSSPSSFSSAVLTSSTNFDNLKDLPNTSHGTPIATAAATATNTPTASVAMETENNSASSTSRTSSNSSSSSCTSSAMSEDSPPAIIRSESSTNAAISYSSDINSSLSRSGSVPLTAAAATATASSASSSSSSVSSSSSSSASASLPPGAPAVLKSSSSSSGVSNFKTALLRLMSDLKALENDTPEGVSASPLDNDNVFLWRACVFGPPETAWEGGIFQLQLQFPKDYPQKPPTARFTSKIYHPNVFADGTLCLDILQDHWSPVYTVSTILTSIQSLLTDPNPASPANPEAAKLYASDPKEYRKKVRACVAKCMSM